MFYHLIYPLKDIFPAFNVFRYLTFRSLMAIFTSFIITLIISPYLIRRLKNIGARDYNKRECCERLNEINQAKFGTPTMGGVIILFAFLITLLLWGNLKNPYVWLVTGSILWMALLGIWDDRKKLYKQNSKGLDKKVKLLWQAAGGLGIGLYLYLQPGHIFHTLTFPFFKNMTWDMGPFYPLFVAFFFTCITNAVNITDGMDGLATGCYLIPLLFYAAVSYIIGNVKFSHYLFLPYVNGSGELMILASSLIGACLGFLWFNAYPAEIFMGDTGALSLGGALATVALITKQEILLFLVGGVFMLEGISVLLQVISWRMFRKKVFLIAPLHHHFQYNGVPETKITLRMWILSLVLALLALATFKLR